MIRVPFRDALDETFRSDRSLWLKLLGCAFVSGFVVAVGLLRGKRSGHLNIDLQSPVVVLIVLISAVAGAGFGFVLSFKDTIQNRMFRGQHVSPVLKIGFGMGWWSLLVWFLTVIVSALIITTTVLMIKL